MSQPDLRKLVIEVNLTPHQVHYWETGEWNTKGPKVGKTFVVSLRAVFRAIEAEKRIVQVDIRDGNIKDLVQSIKQWLTQFGVRYQFNQSFNFPSFWLENGSQIRICDPFKPADPTMGLDRPDCHLVD